MEASARCNNYFFCMSPSYTTWIPRALGKACPTAAGLKYTWPLLVGPLPTSQDPLVSLSFLARCAKASPSPHSPTPSLQPTPSCGVLGGNSIHMFPLVSSERIQPLFKEGGNSQEEPWEASLGLLVLH